MLIFYGIILHLILSLSNYLIFFIKSRHVKIKMFKSNYLNLNINNFDGIIYVILNLVI